MNGDRAVLSSTQMSVHHHEGGTQLGLRRGGDGTWLMKDEWPWHREHEKALVSVFGAGGGVSRGLI